MYLLFPKHLSIRKGSASLLLSAGRGLGIWGVQWQR
jgi:hypothetical protein